MHMRILVTGGAGYIGSHTVLALLENGYDVLIADNFSNSKPECLRRMRELAARPFDFTECDLTDRNAVRVLLQGGNIDAIIHFAALKSVPESVKHPVDYYRNNLISAINLMEGMQDFGVNQFVFSSSATVYGDPETVPIREDFPLSVTNPYGRTKLMMEDMLRDVAAANPALGVCLLRYFNPIGAHPSGRIGEDPNGVPGNLMPYITQVAVGKRPFLNVYGDDYDTEDGTGVRDYIHVTDLAAGHVAALRQLEKAPGCYTYNLGTGTGYSVLQVVHAFEKASGRAIPYQICARRPGDIASCYADPGKAERELGWRAQYGIEQMCADSWNWQKNNPNGFDKPE